MKEFDGRPPDTAGCASHDGDLILHFADNFVVHNFLSFSFILVVRIQF
jgi:hypothetical protein